MPSNADTIPSAGAFASFLIDAAPTPDPRHVAGIDDFLAVPPVPAEPSIREAESEARPVATPYLFAAEAADLPTAAPHVVSDETIRAADLPILPAFSIEAGATPELSTSLGDDDSRIAPPGVVRSFDADLGDSLITNLAAGVEEGRGGDVLPALAASLLADGLLADPAAMLPAVSPAGPTADGGESQGDGFDAWSSSWSSPPATAPSWTAGRDAGPQGFGSFDARPRGEDRGPDGSEALDGLEGRLSQAVARLEEAVAALSAPGPPPLGSRPRGFRGRIDA